MASLEQIQAIPGFDTQHPCPDCGTPFMMTVEGRRVVPSKLIGPAVNGRHVVEGTSQGLWAAKLCLVCLRREWYVADRETMRWELVRTLPGSLPVDEVK